MGNVVVAPVPPVLRPFVGSIASYENTFPHGRERVLPTGRAQLLVNLRDDRLSVHGENGADRRVGGIGLSGVWPAPTVVDPAEQAAVICVAFRPGGAYPFFAAPQSATAGRLVGLEDLWGRAGARLRERLLDARTPGERLRLVECALVERAADVLRQDAATAYAVTALDGGTPVASVVDGLGARRVRSSGRSPNASACRPSSSRGSAGSSGCSRRSRTTGRAGPSWRRPAATTTSRISSASSVRSPGRRRHGTGRATRASATTCRCRQAEHPAPASASLARCRPHLAGHLVLHLAQVRSR